MFGGVERVKKIFGIPKGTSTSEYLGKIWKDITLQAKRLPKMANEAKHLDNMIKTFKSFCEVSTHFCRKYGAEDSARVFKNCADVASTCRLVTGLFNGVRSVEKIVVDAKQTIILIVGLGDPFPTVIVSKNKETETNTEYRGTVEKVIGIFRWGTECLYFIAFAGTFTVVGPVNFVVRVYKDVGPTAQKISATMTKCLLVIDSLRFVTCASDLLGAAVHYYNKVEAGEDTDDDFEDFMEACDRAGAPCISKALKVISGSLKVAHKWPITASVLDLLSALIDLLRSIQDVGPSSPPRQRMAA